MLFNHNKEWTLKGIKETLKFDDETCFKNLKSLMLKGYKLIEVRTDKPGGQFKDDDVFMINEAFSS